MIGGWVGPIVDLYFVGGEETPAGNQIPAVRPVIRRYTDLASPALVSLHELISSGFIVSDKRATAE
jgi:hypothetical protein